MIVARDREAAARELGGRSATLVLPDAPALSDDAVARARRPRRRRRAGRAPLPHARPADPRRRHGGLRGRGRGAARRATCPKPCDRARWRPAPCSLRAAPTASTPATRPATASGSSSARSPATAATAGSPSSTAGRSSRTSTSPRTATPRSALNLMGRHPRRRLVRARASPTPTSRTPTRRSAS